MISDLYLEDSTPLDPIITTLVFSLLLCPHGVVRRHSFWVANCCIFPLKVMGKRLLSHNGVGTEVVRETKIVSMRPSGIGFSKYRSLVTTSG